MAGLKKPILIRSKEILESFDSEKEYKATSKKNDGFNANDNIIENVDNLSITLSKTIMRG